MTKNPTRHEPIHLKLDPKREKLLKREFLLLDGVIEMKITSPDVTHFFEDISKSFLEEE